MPSRRFGEYYTGFAKRMKCKIERSDRRLVLYSCLAYAEHTLPSVVDGKPLGLSFVMPLGTLPKPSVVNEGPFYVKVYGQLARALGYKASFLVNLTCCIGLRSGGGRVGSMYD